MKYVLFIHLFSSKKKKTNKKLILKATQPVKK